MSEVRVPAEQPGLRPLHVLLGAWEMTATVDGRPAARGLTTFDWLEGGVFMIQRADTRADFELSPEWAANSPFPTTTIIGLDDATGHFTMLYSDARGVCRVYQMSLADDVWTILRAAPGFHQRYTGTFSADRRSIAGRWEASVDGQQWRLDFPLNYTKVA